MNIHSGIRNLDFPFIQRKIFRNANIHYSIWRMQIMITIRTKRPDFIQYYYPHVGPGESMFLILTSMNFPLLSIAMLVEICIEAQITRRSGTLSTNEYLDLYFCWLCRCRALIDTEHTDIQNNSYAIQYWRLMDFQPFWFILPILHNILLHFPQYPPPYVAPNIPFSYKNIITY